MLLNSGAEPDAAALQAASSLDFELRVQILLKAGGRASAGPLKKLRSMAMSRQMLEIERGSSARGWVMRHGTRHKMVFATFVE